ncbi:calphotin isoform X2 [Drosophila hydei]|uniref:Calphotin isoform X2 n=1 Tax=Drosophila hydei TaxID=7224 RepID=A0A6J1MD52_DROHY|nr:calphotin isoform X2 [Drosophila hydei]
MISIQTPNNYQLPRAKRKNLKMFKAQLAKVLFLGALLFVGSQAQPLRGRKRAFGVGLLGGALAGAVIGNAVAKAPGSSKAAAPAAAPVAQVVETGVPDANGCYKQTIKEPVAGNTKLYTETVHLVCPPKMPAATSPPAIPVPVQVVPMAHAPAASVYPVAAAVPAAVVNHTSNANATHANVTHTFTNLGHPGPVPVVVPAPAAAPVAAAPVAPHSSVTFAYAVDPRSQPAQPAQMAPQGTAHVILLSKTVKKQKSAANTINISQGLLILVVLYCLISK